MDQSLKSLDELVSLCKRRGFIFQSSEVYGGLNSCWDYGPLGVQLKNNIKESWWKSMTLRRDVVGVDCSIFMHSDVWKASGHQDGFHDIMVDCKACKSRFRADHIDMSKACTNCGAKGQFTEPKNFNLMFKTNMGPVEDSSSVIFLRPETAQGIFINFLNVQNTMRMKIPFGIAQIGKAFRNEITPSKFIFRTREFEQMEMQYFVRPGEQLDWMEKWKEIRYNWHRDNGIRESSLRFHPHEKNELAHYADKALDIEYRFPHGWGEMEGIHSRTDFDLDSHQKLSGKKLEYLDQEDNNKKYLPYVVETSVGCDRCLLAILCDAYCLENADDSKQRRVVLRLHHKIAPIKIAILPLMKKEPLEGMAQKIFEDLSTLFPCDYDTSGSIGKRYRRHDEIGTPYCLTIDYDSSEDNTVTIRNRDTMKQERVSCDKLKEYFGKHLC